MAAFENIVQAVGNTPLIRLNHLSDETGAEIWAKAEFFNPMASVKDRIARSMVLEAEKEGLLNSGGTIIEATSGNTGIGLAFTAAARGYKLILCMPDTMSVERQKILKALGARLVLTPGSGGMKAAIAKAEEIYQETTGAFMPRQFKNPANPLAHYRTTAPEIWKDTAGKIDFLVAGVGTGGTISGCGLYLKEKKPEVKLVAVEPLHSAVLSGKEPGPHKLQGIGAGFIPDILDRDLLDEVLAVDQDEAGEMARKLAREEGLLVGISSGANVLAASQVAARAENKGKTIVTILCDSGERYLSTWLFQLDKIREEA